MITNTFLHISGIGHKTEELLWKNGILTWDSLEEKLASGASIQDLLRPKRYHTPSLFPDDVLDQEFLNKDDDRPSEWLHTLELSRKALSSRDYSFFLDRLDPKDQWRLLATEQSNALYVDIETTGLSRDYHYTTVIGTLHRGKFRQWTWPEPLDDFFELMSSAELLITFNGKRFDMPFLVRQFPTLKVPQAHIDLLDVARALGYSGGQKQIEISLKLDREQSVIGIGGEEAVQLWSKALYGDKQSYNQLIKYNQSDVVLMPQIAARACDELLVQFPVGSTAVSSSKIRLTKPSVSRKCLSFEQIQEEWSNRRAGLHDVLPTIQKLIGKSPTSVGIDLRGNPNNPTGIAICNSERVDTKIVYSDNEIVEITIASRPDIVSIDAPLFLPRGRDSVSDDSPCRKIGGIVRDVERILWSRGIPVYPALIRHMQGLTKRGMDLANTFRQKGFQVIESYPGAVQDILGIARKGNDPKLLECGLQQFGFVFENGKSHDELDAITSALVSYFYLANDYESIGAEDEGFMIIPRIPTKMRWSS